MTIASNPVELKVERTVSPDEALPSKPEQRAETPASPVPEAPVRKPGAMKKLLGGVAGVAILAGAAYFGWQYWTVGRFQESTDDAYVQADVITIAPKVPGYIKQVLVADNQSVKQGQVLASIDERDYAVALRQAKADVAAAEADIDNYEAMLDQQRSVIAQAQATVAADQAAEMFAEQDNQRYTQLAQTGFGSVQNAQQATSRIAVAKATVVKDQAAVTAAEKQIGTLKAQLEKAKASLAHDQAVEAQAELNLSYTTITAPTDGLVGNRTLRVGSYVQAGTQLMAVVPSSGAYIVGNFKETQLTNVQPGQPVEVEVDTFPGVTVKGKVDSISPASGQQFALLPPDNATGNFTKIVQRIPVKIVLDAGNPLEGKLRPGMSVTPTINVKQAAEQK